VSAEVAWSGDRSESMQRGTGLQGARPCRKGLLPSGRLWDGYEADIP
jgi:hypothetical protein